MSTHTSRRIKFESTDEAKLKIDELKSSPHRYSDIEVSDVRDRVIVRFKDNEYYYSQLNELAIQLPSEEQTTNFADYFRSCQSWYKQLCPYPLGDRFTFFLSLENDDNDYFERYGAWSFAHDEWEPEVGYSNVQDLPLSLIDGCSAVLTSLIFNTKGQLSHPYAFPPTGWSFIEQNWQLGKAAFENGDLELFSLFASNHKELEITQRYVSYFNDKSEPPGEEEHKLQLQLVDNTLRKSRAFFAKKITTKQD